MTDLSSERWRNEGQSPRAAVMDSITKQLQEIDADTDDILGVLKGVGLSDASIVAMLQQLTADVAFDTSVTYQAVLASEAAVLAAIASFQSEVLAQLAAILAALVGPPEVAAQLLVTITNEPGGSVPVTISVDDTGAHADYAWADDHGDPVPAPLDASGGAFVVTLGSDNAAVGTLAQDATTSTRFDITPVAMGDANVVTTVVDSTGAPGVWPPGSPGALAGTPITEAPVPFTVVAGAAGELNVTASA